jgi:hypothetical protein
MIIVGVDYHPSDRYIAFADTETGECGATVNCQRIDLRKSEADSVLVEVFLLTEVAGNRTRDVALRLAI